MIRDLIQDLEESITFLEDRTGYLEEGESKRIVGKRVGLWFIFILVAGLVLFLFGISASQIHIYLPGGAGSLILVLAAVRKDVNTIHRESGAIEGAEKNMMPSPIRRTLKRIADRFFGLLLVSSTFFQQLVFL